MDSINNINETGGAGDWGTDKARARLQKDTPGQEITKGKKMKTFKDILNNIDESSTNIKETATEVVEVQEAMSEKDKKKRLAMIRQAVEKINKQNADKAKKDALAMMKASGMFDEDAELQEIRKAPQIKHLNIYGSEISGLRSGGKYYMAMAVDMRGKLMYKVIDEFGSIETIDLKTFAKKFG